MAPSKVTRGDSGGSETVLVVEDRAEVREFAENVLAGAGYRVLTAAHGPEALDIAREAGHHVDLLLTDVIMPGMTGSELAAALVAELPSLRVILMSGYTAGTQLDGKHGSPLTKPFTPGDLLRRVRGELDAATSQ